MTLSLKLFFLIQISMQFTLGILSHDTIHQNTQALMPFSAFQTHESGLSVQISDFRQVESTIRTSLKMTYGERSGELQEFERLLKDLKAYTADVPHSSPIALRIPPGSLYTGDDVERQASSLVHLGLEKIKTQQRNLLNVNWPQRFSELKKNTATDTPCNSPEECNHLNNLLNACNTARAQCFNLYTTYNQVTNVLNQVMSVLCACIFAGPVEICALKSFPYTCVFPYQAFSTFSTGSSSVWETVKTLSSLCRFHVAPNFLPKIA